MSKLVQEGKLLIDGHPFTMVDCEITRKNGLGKFVIEKGKITFLDAQSAETFGQLQGTRIELVLFSEGVIPIKLLDTPSRHKLTVRIESCGEG